MASDVLVQPFSRETVMGNPITQHAAQLIFRFKHSLHRPINSRWGMPADKLSGASLLHRNFLPVDGASAGTGTVLAGALSTAICFQPLHIYGAVNHIPAASGWASQGCLLISMS